MILDFSITNFRSIKETQTFSMLPSARVKERKNGLLTIAAYPDLEALPVAIIYGGNNTGKSNLVTAFSAMKFLVLETHRFTVGDLLNPNENFLFDKQTQTAPTIFELDFIAPDKKRYLYIIEFNKAAILREELHYYHVSKKERTSRRKLFIRLANQPISFGDDFKGIKKPIEERLIENMLFLSKAVQENNITLRPIMEFFRHFLNITSMSEGHIEFQNRYFGKLVSEDNESQQLQTLNNALRAIDSGILYLEVEKKEEISSMFRVEEDGPPNLTKQQQQIRESLLDALKHEIQAIHRLFDGQKEIGTQPISLAEESEGTRKFIALFTKLMELSTSGGIFIVDELERSLHPLLTQALIALISNPKTNPKNAQLIFTSHDITLFDSLDKDQVNVLEKDKYGATEIYTFSDIKGLRNDIPLQKWYMRGKLGGIPNISINEINHHLSKLHEQVQ